MPKVAAIAGISMLIVVALYAATASGEIYKCTAKKRLPTYQNFPCEFDSLGSSPKSSGPGSATTVAGMSAAPGTKHAAARQGDGWSPAAHSSAPRVGMTTDDVQAIWGKPIDTSKEEFVKGTFETWTYANSRTVQFDRKGRVTSIKW
jgi:hypothetical protein